MKRLTHSKTLTTLFATLCCLAMARAPKHTPTPAPTPTASPSVTITPTPTATPSASPMGLLSPHGVWCILGQFETFDGTEPYWSTPVDSGITIRTSFAKLEPTEGTFDFSYISKALALAQANGKGLGVYVAALAEGTYPAWLKCQTVPSGGKMGTMAVPWDPAFLAAWKACIAAFGQAFDGKITYTVMGGMGGTGESILTKEPSGIAAFDAAGGLTAWQGSCTAITDAYAAAFPHSAFFFSAQAPYGAEAEDCGKVLATLVTGLAQKYPHRLGVKNSVLSANTKDIATADLIHDLSPTNPAGQQCINSSVGFGDAPPLGGLEPALNAGLAIGDQYFEVYRSDIVNPDNAAFLSQINAQLNGK